jgi:hypothetical protein
MNLFWLKRMFPDTWAIMREAAVWRHVMLVYGTFGFTPRADKEMERHLELVRAVYDKRK